MNARAAAITASAPLPVGVHLRPRLSEAPFPLDQPGCRLFARARHGLWHAVRFLGLQPGDELLVPAYHHGSEVEALARAGLVCRFHGGTPGLEPDGDELESLRGPRTRALYLIHYLGFPQDVERWRSWCDARGLLLIEDVAQSWFATAAGRPLGDFGDVSLFCLYKTCGVPEGAAVLLRAPHAEGWVRAQETPGRIGIGGTARRHAAWLASRSALLARVERYRRMRIVYAPSEDFELGDVQRPPSRALTYLLARLADPRRVALRRRANYRHLLTRFHDRVPSPFHRLPDSAVPYVFPIESDDKHRLLHALEAAGIRPFNLWSVPHPSLPVGAFPDAARRRRRILGLPVHQELRLRDVEHIAAALEGAGLRRAPRSPAIAAATRAPAGVRAPGPQGAEWLGHRAGAAIPEEVAAAMSEEAAISEEAAMSEEAAISEAAAISDEAAPAGSEEMAIPEEVGPLRREEVGSFSALGEEWDELAAASRNIFATREWIETWWRHYGRGEPRISAWRDGDGRLVAILPLYAARRGPLRAVRFLGHGAANELGPICRPTDRPAAARALRLELDEAKPEWSLFVGSFLPGEEPWAHLVEGHTLRRHPSPRVPARGRTWDDYLASLSTKFRKEIRYSESRLRRRYEVRFRTTRHPEHLDSDMDTFDALHRARWDDESTFLPRSAFYRDVAAAFLRRGWLRLSIIELDGIPAAARFDFHFAGVHCAYNAGRDPSYRRDSLGLVLRAMTMRQAFEEGMDEYRFLLGGERYKYRFAPDDPGLVTIGLSTGPLGAAALTAVRGLVRTPRGRALLRSVVAK